MSFILDALRKIDRGRKTEPPRPEDLVEMEGGRQWGTKRRGLPVSVAILSVLALGLSAYALLRTLGPDAVAPSSSPPDPSPSTAPSSPPSLSLSDSRSSSPVAPVGLAAPLAKSAVVVAPTPSSPPASSPADSLDSALETGPPVRLVGRNASPEEPSNLSDPPGPSGSEVEPAPSDLGLPPLVLQGTSVVGERPVAVVNYQRIFEGDIIEGARVVKISDRAVELSFQGRRFTLRF